MAILLYEAAILTEGWMSPKAQRGGVDDQNNLSGYKRYNAISGSMCVADLFLVLPTNATTNDNILYLVL